MKKIFLVIFMFLTIWVFNFANAETLWVCTREYNPVVWTDWKTYSNPCVAKQAWVYKEENISENIACPAIYLPVVWTDWKTYSNECMAKAAWAYESKKIVTNEKVLHSYLDFSFDFPMSLNSEKEFLEKYWKICSTATDSINIHFVRDWKLAWSTRVWIPENFKPSYSCKSYNWLVLDFELRETFEKSLDYLSVEEMKLINSALKNFYSSEKDFFKNLERTVKLVEKIEKIKMTSKFSSQKPVAVLDYVKYQVIDLFTQK